MKGESSLLQCPILPRVLLAIQIIANIRFHTAELICVCPLVQGFEPHTPYKHLWCTGSLVCILHPENQITVKITDGEKPDQVGTGPLKHHLRVITMLTDVPHTPWTMGIKNYQVNKLDSMRTYWSLPPYAQVHKTLQPSPGQSGSPLLGPQK